MRKNASVAVEIAKLSTASGTKGAAAFGSFAISTATEAFFRITVRVIGPRNTVSYVQAVVY